MGKGQIRTAPAAAALVLTALAALTTAGWSFAQQPAQPPSTPPTTAPNAGARAGGGAAPVAVDDSTPRGALKMLLSAMQSADTEKLHVLLVAHSPLEERMVDAIAKRAD